MDVCFLKENLNCRGFWLYYLLNLTYYLSSSAPFVWNSKFEFHLFFRTIGNTQMDKTRPKHKRISLVAPSSHDHTIPSSPAIHPHIVIQICTFFQEFSSNFVVSSFVLSFSYPHLRHWNTLSVGWLRRWIGGGGVAVRIKDCNKWYALWNSFFN